MSSKNHPAGPPPAVGDKKKVRIEKLAIGGAGIARTDGFVLFVDLAAPDDELLVQVTSMKERHGEARILEILQPGPSRRTPPCPYAGECGGCNWQQLTDEEQRRQKQLLLNETLSRFLPGRSVPLLPFVPSPRPLRYRNRVQPRYQQGRLGYFKRKSHEFLPVRDCLLVEEPLSEYFRNPPTLSGKVPEDRLELRLGPDGGTSFSFEGEGFGEGFSFSQVNRHQNEDLVRTVLEWASPDSTKMIYDLYCGSGNFTFPLAERHPSSPVTGVEMDSQLVLRARERAGARKGLVFQIADVSKWVRRRPFQKDALVILDPPRAGAGREVMRALASSSVREIIYIACHPVSLARDLAFFFELAPREWTLSKVQGFEMFPQTDHLETIAHLKVDSL